MASALVIALALTPPVQNAGQASGAPPVRATVGIAVLQEAARKHQTVQVELKDGRTIEGDVVSCDDERLVVAERRKPQPTTIDLADVTRVSRDSSHTALWLVVVTAGLLLFVKGYRECFYRC